MRQMKLVSLILIFGLMVGCSATLLTNIKDGQKINDDEGVVVTRLHEIYKGTSILNNVVYTFHYNGRPRNRYQMVMSKRDELKVISLPAGHYEWERMYDGGFFADVSNNPGFDVKAGKITYIGDIYSVSIFTKEQFYKKIIVRNERDSIVSELDLYYPEMIEMHNVFTHLTSFKR